MSESVIAILIGLICIGLVLKMVKKTIKFVLVLSIIVVVATIIKSGGM